MTSSVSSVRMQLSIFFISAALIAYQLLLVKLFSIQYWYHFAYLIISIALLGFGASGAFILVFRNFLNRHAALVLFACPILTVPAIWINVYLSHAIGFNPMMIVWQKSEIIRLVLLCLALFVPFFLGALCIGLAFSAAPQHIHRLYFANLTGSGLGCLIALLSVFHIKPYDILLAISVISTGAGLAAAGNTIRRAIGCAVLVFIIALHAAMLRDIPLPMSPFKDLSQAANLMEAKRESETFGPLGLVTVLDSPAYHYFPDLSLKSPFFLPRQKGLFLDGNTVGAIYHLEGDPKAFYIMDYRTNALAYKLLNEPEVLIIGGGSGLEIINAGYHGAKALSVVEMNGDIVRLMQGPYAAFSGNIYHPENAAVIVEEGRGYLQKTNKFFDLIQISLLESMGTASAGVYSVNENYLLTKEALGICLDRLKPGGILSISRWIRNPPRDNIKLLAMAVEAVEGRGNGGVEPAHSIILIRSWQTATLLVKKGYFHEKDTAAVRSFCEARSFDLCYLPGIKEKDTNVFNKMEEDLLYRAALKILSPEREAFYRTYPFYIRPATDDRPFFSHFFNMAMMSEYARSWDRALIPFLDWGYVLVWITAGILAVLGMGLILAPIPFVLPSSKGLATVFVYFGALGTAYMFLEISLLQQFIRYLYDPVFSAGVVIGSFLFYSGTGSLLSVKIRPLRQKHLWGAVCLIGLMGIVFVTSDSWLQSILSECPLWARMMICSTVIAPLALPMGFFFPSGLGVLAPHREALIPWAWGINGFFSVIGSAFTLLIAIGYGFKSVILIALLLYVLAATAFRSLQEGGS
jgi:SAM-dependent methyltransferase